MTQPSEITQVEIPLTENASLLDAVDSLLNRGVVLSGEAVVSLAGVELVYLGLNLVLSSVETLRRTAQAPGNGPLVPPLSGPQPGGVVPSGQPGTHQPRGLAGALGGTPLAPASQRQGTVIPAAGSSVTARPDVEGTPAQSLAQLVLTLIELLRKLLERQAVRRMEGQSLSDEDIERMGLALLELEAKMAELREVFGLTEEDLQIDLGPLGRLL